MSGVVRTLCEAVNCSLRVGRDHGVFLETLDVALRICVKTLRSRPDLRPYWPRFTVGLAGKLT